MKLFGSTRSPFVRKAAIVAHEADVWGDIDFVEIEIPAPAPNEAHRAANPLMKLPTLVLADGAAIYDSPVICAYLDGGLFPDAGPARWRALTRAGLADGLLDMMLLWRAELRRPEVHRQTSLFATWEKRREAALDRMAEEIGEGFDIGDVATGVALDYLDYRFEGLDWRAARPALAAWHRTFVERPSVKATKFGESWA